MRSLRKVKNFHVATTLLLRCTRIYCFDEFPTSKKVQAHICASYQRLEISFRFLGNKEKGEHLVGIGGISVWGKVGGEASRTVKLYDLYAFLNQRLHLLASLIDHLILDT